MQADKIIAVFIAYNAEKTLESFWHTFPKNIFDEIILIDDVSKDNTFELAQKLGIHSYLNPVNLGYGGNLKKALNMALDRGADIIVDLHPDGEYKPSGILPAIEQVKKGSEFVLGNRFHGDKSPAKHGMYAWKVLPLLFLSWLCKNILRLPITDYHQGFRVYTRSLLEKVNFNANSNDYSFSLELLAQAAFHKAKVSEVPVEVAYTGDKRGASLKSSIVYSLKTFKILFFFVCAKLGLSSEIFRKSSFG